LLVMEHVRWEQRPRLRRPVMVAAFEGWNDAADASSTAARYLRERWDARPFATIDPEEFFDFSATRPQVRLSDGLTREIVWPETELSAASLPGGERDVIVMVGHEPQLKWRTFCSEVTTVATELRVELVVTLGALLADVAHTRPVRVTGTAADPELVARLGLQRSSYEGPTGIVGVLHDACTRAHIPSASLWAAIPHYVGGTPSPKAALALVRRAGQLLSTPLITTDLEIASAAYESQVTEVVEEDDDVAGYVRRLELVDDEVVDDDDEFEEPDGSSGQVDGERLVAELERFLRDQGS
jgi:proteasome assembly chaperone (PAC2) family protein